MLNNFLLYLKLFINIRFKQKHMYRSAMKQMHEFGQKGSRIFNFLGKYLLGLQFLSYPLQSNSTVILYTCANIEFSLKNTSSKPL